MRETLVYHLFLEEEIHVLLLNNKRELKVLDIERQLLRIKDPQHVDLLRDLLNTTLQLTNTRLIGSILPENVLKDILADCDLLIQIDLIESGGKQEVLANGELLFL